MKFNLKLTSQQIKIQFTIYQIQNCITKSIGTLQRQYDD